MFRRIRCFKDLQWSLCHSALLSQVNIQNFETSNMGIYEVWKQMYVTRKWQCVLFHKLLLVLCVSNTIWGKLPQAGSILTTGRRRDYCACAMRPCCQLFYSLSYGFSSRNLKIRAEHYKLSLEVKSDTSLNYWYISFNLSKEMWAYTKAKLNIWKILIYFHGSGSRAEESFSISGRAR